MTTAMVAGRPRRACADCGFVHFPDPKVGVGVAARRHGRVLLVRRAMQPEQGRWTLPSGFLDAGEDARAAAEREVVEETGLECTVGRLLEVVPGGGSATLFLVYAGRVGAGEPAPGDDVDDAGFFDLEELPPLAFGTTAEQLAGWAAAAN